MRTSILALTVVLHAGPALAWGSMDDIHPVTIPSARARLASTRQEVTRFRRALSDGSREPERTTAEIGVKAGLFFGGALDLGISRVIDGQGMAHWYATGTPAITAGLTAGAWARGGITRQRGTAGQPANELVDSTHGRDIRAIAMIIGTADANDRRVATTNDAGYAMLGVGYDRGGEVRKPFNLRLWKPVKSKMLRRVEEAERLQGLAEQDLADGKKDAAAAKATHIEGLLHKVGEAHRPWALRRRTF
jgi:hypothetical protein